MTANIIPSVGLWRTDAHKYHWNGGPAMPGVTSIISKVDKSGPLIGWAKGVTADAALDNLDDLSIMAATKGRPVAKAWLTAHATAESDSAKDLGTRIHLYAEQVARGAKPELPEEHMAFVWAYQRFLDDYRPEFKSLERFVCNLTEGYGGTFDFIALIDGKWTLGDLKTGKGVYSEARLQLAALGRAEFIGMPNDPKQYRMPQIEQYVVLHVRPDAYAQGYQLLKVGINDADWRAFLGARDIYRWAEQRPSSGEPMQVKEKVA
jgi:hypothetical protein